ncbi:superoxide dismutase, Cu-Zn family [Lentzea waywayandensis]|uniref:Superoxide dismutase, Cu-Zn family n=1 Tax=Lentzea waywayandensis TaxID=84724 RepID=A0A1I6EMD1_9PSEU|nr:superoxide dismutase family protein [Lentzea waywayandensis]SFR18711.1 superoxide dismutase, Cu-Zn family [Lentzea waywayandensis]
MKMLAVAAAAALVFTGTAHAEPAKVAHTSAKFESYSATAKAVTYDAKVPAGAKVTVVGVLTVRGGTTVLLVLKGLQPHRAYGAHVHVKKCGAAPADSGPHFQNVVDPVQPSVDPAYANPRNEIWLDVHTDGNGFAHTQSTVDWQFTERHAQSVVLHNEHTHTKPGEAGTAGPRLACVNVDF